MIERIYRALLFLFPREFRERFGDEMLATAAELRRTRGHGPTATVRGVRDFVVSAVRAHADARTDERALTAIYPSRRSTVDFILQDIGFAIRSLRRDRIFTAFAVATLALGIGANAAMFSIADRLLIRGPAHVRDAHHVVRLYLTTKPSGMREYTTDTFGNVTLDAMRAGAHVAEGIGAYELSDATVGSGADARTVHAGRASASLFPMLGVHAAVGRFFSDAEDAPSNPQHVVVLGMGLWRDRFAGATDVIGRSVTIDDEQYTVIGVAPAGFTGAELGPVDVWTPVSLLGSHITQAWRTSWNAQWLKIVFRLRPGATFEQAAAQMTAVYRGAYAGDEHEMAVADLRVAPLSANDAGVESADLTIVRWLTAVALVVLLIACANVVNLLLARGAHRGRELAIRAALGASRARLIRLVLLESMLLAAVAGVLGVGFAYGLAGSAQRMLFADVDWPSNPIDLRVLVVSALVAIATGLVVGLVPALRNSKAGLAGALKTSTRDGGVHHGKLRVTLTIAQSALSVALLVGAGLFVRSLWNVRNLRLGIDADRVLRAEVNRPPIGRLPEGPPRDAERARRRTFYVDAAEQVRRLPGVQHVAVTVGLPFLYRFGVRVRNGNLDSIPRLASGGPSISAVSPDYFETIGTKVLEGRSFTTADREGSERVAIVSNLMARTVWPGRSALGQCLHVFADTMPCTRVVGVAEDVHRNRLREDPPMHFYIPLGQEIGFGGSNLLVRGFAAPTALIPDVRRALLTMDPTITFADLSTVQTLIDPQVRPWRLGATVFALTGLLALLVAAIGIYSVTAYFVTERTHEIGIRLALGASAARVVGAVARGAVQTAVVGVIVGVGIAAVGGKFLQPLLFNESARDPVVFGGVAIVLTVVALFASVIPAGRAGRIDPLEALRAE